MQLALRGKQLLIKRIAALLMVLVVFCSPLVKPPVKVEATVGVAAIWAGMAGGAVTAASVPAVVGGLVVATVLAGAGIGVSALVNGESYQDACQRVWNNSKDRIYGTMLLAGTAAAPLLQLSRDTVSTILQTFQSMSPSYQSAAGTPFAIHAQTMTGLQIDETLRVDTRDRYTSHYGDWKKTFADYSLLSHYSRSVLKNITAENTWLHLGKSIAGDFSQDIYVRHACPFEHFVYLSGDTVCFHLYKEQVGEKF